MSEVTIVAIVGALATIVVGVAASLAQIFGPAWRDARARAQTRLDEGEQLRYQRALELIESLSRHDIIKTGSSSRDVLLATAAMLATLRAGETKVAEYIQDRAHAVESSQARNPREIGRFSDRLFAYLRGDLSMDELKNSDSESKHAESADGI